MTEKLFFQILNESHELEKLFETKVNALRHFSYSEAEEIVKKIKEAIKNHNFEILNRDKNIDFMHDEGINKENSCQIIDLFLNPKNLIAVIPDWDHPGKELYLFSIKISMENKKDKFIYLKIRLTTYGKVIAVSWHGQTEKIRVDYRQAEDKTEADTSKFFRKLYQNWERIYNRFNENKMIDCLPNGDEDITIIFEHPIEDTLEFRKNFCKTVPKDFGYKFKDIENSMVIEEDYIKVHLPFKKFKEVEDE